MYSDLGLGFLLIPVARMTIAMPLKYMEGSYSV